jgi:putative nucleotidyltransferase with HDIG domain
MAAPTSRATEGHGGTGRQSSATAPPNAWARAALYKAGLCVLLFLAAGPRAGLASPPDPGHFSVRAFGATGDGHTLDTEAVNRAIAAAGAAGGGVVEFPAGEYLCHSIRLQSRVAIRFAPGATIVAAEPPREGVPGGYDPAEPNPWDRYQDFGHSHWHNSLIWGEDVEDVSITGPGLIYGRGLSRGNGRVSLPVNVTAPTPPGGHLPDVLAADGPLTYPARPDLVPGPFGYPNARDTLPDGVGNKSIALKRGRNVTLRDFSVLHGGHFAILATGVDNLTIDNLRIDTNRDGIDVDACRNVRISNTSVNSPWDDGICLKSSHALGERRVTENVTITGCFVSGYDEGTLLDGTRQRVVRRRGGPMGRVKLGTEAGGGFRNIAIASCVFDHSRGLALEQVDGGVLEDVVVTNLTMRDVPNAPVFIRLGARLRAPGASGPGVVRRVTIDNLNAAGVAPDQGLFVAGLPGHSIEDVVLSNIRIRYAGGGTAEQAGRVVPEMESGYPEPHLFGVLPSWGLFARHVAHLVVRGMDLGAEAVDERPAIALDDVAGARFSDVGLFSGADHPLWSLANVSGLRARDTSGLPDGVHDRTGGLGPTRETALAALEARVKEPERLRHALAVEAIMRELARRSGGDGDQWGLAGLLHDIDRTETDGTPARHGVVGARLLAELGFSEPVVRAVETHDDGPGLPRTLPIAHALYCADQIYWRILSSGLRPGSPAFVRATLQDVLGGLRRAGHPDGIGDRLRSECGTLGLSMDEVLQLSLTAMRDVAGD